jgi:hypothetical protein
MASKRIDELDARVVADTDLLPVTPSGGPSGKATVAAIVAEGLSQPNSASSGAGASITVKAADGVTSGAGGSIVLQPGTQATTGGDGYVLIQHATTSKYYCSVRAPSAGVVEFGILPDGGDIQWRFLNRLSSSNICVISKDAGLSCNNYYDLAFTSFRLGTAGLRFGSNLPISWADNASQSTTQYTGLAPKTRGVLGITDGSTGGGSLSYVSSTPAAIVANQNNYVLTGSAFQRLNCTTASDITGIAPPTSGAHVDGRMIRLVNVGTATVTLKHNSASSTAANRMYRHNATDVSLTVNEWADLVYDSTDNGSGAAGWRVVKYA